MENIISIPTLFFNSPFFGSLITLIGAAIAYRIYNSQKRDRVVNTAKKILFEIRRAEKSIETIKRFDFDLNRLGRIVVLSHNSWKTESYLLINEFDLDEFDSLTQFYEDCESIQFLIDKQDDFFWVTTESKASYLQQAVIDHVKKHIETNIENQNTNIPNEKFLEHTKTLFTVLSNESVPYAPERIPTELRSLVTKVGFVTTTNVGQKLKKIIHEKYL